MEKQTVAEGNLLFPVFLKLTEFRVLLVGAGKVGHEKLRALLSAHPQANIRIVAKVFSKEVSELAALYPNIECQERAFLEGDLYCTNLLLVAVNDYDTSRWIKSVAEKHKVLTNVADVPELCDFYLSSVVKKGDLKIAISTNGKSPTLAKRLRETLDVAIPDEIQESIFYLNQVRNQLSGEFAEKVRKLNELTSLLAITSERSVF